MRIFSVLFCLLLLLDSAFAQQERPNIIFILADDLGWKDLGCYGSDVFESPSLDRLAKQGMRFTDAYAASCVCSPTRAAFLTGKYPGRTDLTVFLGGGGGAPALKHLPHADVTIAERLKEVGYRTAHVGKWHLGGSGSLPQDHGFEINIGGNHTGRPAGGYHLPNQMKLEGAKKGDYLTDRLTDEGVKVIEQAVADGKPLFLYQSYHSVHVPIQGKPELVTKIKEQQAQSGKTFNIQYAAMIQSLDAGVGRIMSTLERLDIADNTLVIFTSDNGGYAYSRGKKNNVTSCAPLRRGKGYNYEGGNRVACIATFPGKIPPDSTSITPLISTDFYPTILATIGLPLDSQQHADGVDLWPVLKDPFASLSRKSLFWHYPHSSPQGGTPSGAIRMGNWKLIEFFGDQHVELYNLSDDLSEKTDLANSNPEKRKELHEALVAWQKAVDAKMPK